MDCQHVGHVLTVSWWAILTFRSTNPGAGPQQVAGGAATSCPGLALVCQPAQWKSCQSQSFNAVELLCRRPPPVSAMNFWGIHVLLSLRNVLRSFLLFASSFGFFFLGKLRQFGSELPFQPSPAVLYPGNGWGCSPHDSLHRELFTSTAHSTSWWRWPLVDDQGERCCCATPRLLYGEISDRPPHVIPPSPQSGSMVHARAPSDHSFSGMRASSPFPAERMDSSGAGDLKSALSSSCKFLHMDDIGRGSDFSCSHDCRSRGNAEVLPNSLPSSLPLPRSQLQYVFSVRVFARVV
mgnify:CR=1 FL=1